MEAAAELIVPTLIPPEKGLSALKAHTGSVLRNLLPIIYPSASQKNYNNDPYLRGT